MIFLTIFFAAYYFILLIKGSFFQEFNIQLGEIKLKQAETGNLESNENNIKILGIGCMYFMIVIVLCVYIVSSLKYDPIKYPTIGLIIFCILNIAFNSLKKKKKEDLTTDAGRQEFRTQLYKENASRYKFGASVKRIIFLSYFVYMFYILIF